MICWCFYILGEKCRSISRSITLKPHWKTPYSSPHSSLSLFSSSYCLIILLRICAFLATRLRSSWNISKHGIHRWTLHVSHRTTPAFFIIVDSVAHVLSWHLGSHFPFLTGFGQCFFVRSRRCSKHLLLFDKAASVNPTNLHFFSFSDADTPLDLLFDPLVAVVILVFVDADVTELSPLALEGIELKYYSGCNHAFPIWHTHS